MTWGIISTWRMGIEGITRVKPLLESGCAAGKAVVEAVQDVENYPFYKSVGFGGLPSENGVVELDAAYMDGTTLSIGAVAGIKDYSNPVAIARRLSEEYYNALLIGTGAEEFAHKNGFERKNMLTPRAKRAWEKRKQEIIEKDLAPYDGHDTVGMVSLDQSSNMAVATSTSGLFMKRPGRVGDSPLSGSGFYVDSEIGGATATGLGEDIMKGCTSYEIVRLMGEGLHPQEAAEKAVNQLHETLLKRRGVAGDISVVCMNKKGEWGVATNLKEFSFVVATDKEAPTVYLAYGRDGKTTYEVAPKEWLDKYEKRITANEVIF